MYKYLGQLVVILIGYMVFDMFFTEVLKDWVIVKYVGGSWCSGFCSGIFSVTIFWWPNSEAEE